ncbi:hypothetical protein EUV02_03985 [Polymorphobacter arshaanensis]|uniref:MarR family transcriptional regulator n=1 Tax=Glacieibacterium arshaanense TaxID=2511025 RepID=A0A4Y9ERB5_9SPHN|nr:hypothetical protein [Polymorphobacter arshaanensis]TFU06181.1 hypothetical protein EUV02_03985 [Polymorphobacter arshaanensis]
MTDDYKSALVKADRILSFLRTAISPLLPLQVAHTFVMVARNEGKNLTEITELMSSKVSTVSRHLLDLGDYTRKMEPGYGLVESKTAPTNLRTKQFYLTSRGKLVARELATILQES